MRNIFLILIALAGSSAFGQICDDNPGSLWQQRTKNPLLDRTAKREGDIVTVLISEISAANFAATAATSKADATSVNRINVPVLAGLFKSLGIGASSSTNGTGSTTQTGNLTATMTAVVKKTLPNGYLVIEGTRWVQVNKETQVFKISGIVRPDDVRSDNTVLSDKIAEAQITVTGKGAIADRTRRGILTRILDWLF